MSSALPPKLKAKDGLEFFQSMCRSFDKSNIHYNNEDGEFLAGWKELYRVYVLENNNEIRDHMLTKTQPGDAGAQGK